MVHSTAADPIPVWVKVVVLLCVVVTGTGAVVAVLQPGMLVEPHAEITAAVRTYAAYLLTRNAVVAITLLLLLLMKARWALGNLLAIAGAIQVLDCVMDCVEARWVVAPGVLVLGVLFLAGATRLCGPFWRRDAWI